MQRLAFLTLLLFLPGCTIVPFLIQTSIDRTDIASGIPASTQPCVTVSRTNQSEQSLREEILAKTSAAFSSGNFKQLEDYYSQYRQRTSRTPSGQWHLQYFYRGLSSSSFNSQDENDWKEYETRLLQWMKQYPESPAAQIAYGSFLMERAWHIRGTEYSREVSPEDWKPFNEYIQLASNHLENSKSFSSADPQWYVEMLLVARAQGWSSMQVRSLLQEAVSKEAYYSDTYRVAFVGLLPKWGGSFAAAEKFANDAAAITSQCEGKGMYARIYWRAIDSNPEFEDNPFATSKANWDEMKMGFEDIIRLYPDRWNLNQYARFACIAQDKETARRLLNQIGNEPILKAWENPIITYPECYRWASRE